jgi:myosin V
VDDAKDYKHLREAMTTVGIDSEQQESIFKTLAALLHLGNVVFAPADEGESSKVSDDTKQYIEHACALLKVDKDSMEESLTTRTLSTGGRRGTMYRIPLKPFEAVFARDALSKHLYGKLFDWLVSAVNNGIPMAAEAKHFIGILDISGREEWIYLYIYMCVYVCVCIFIGDV